LPRLGCPIPVGRRPCLPRLLGSRLPRRLRWRHRGENEHPPHRPWHLWRLRWLDLRAGSRKKGGSARGGLPVRGGLPARGGLPVSVSSPESGPLTLARATPSTQAHPRPSTGEPALRRPRRTGTGTGAASPSRGAPRTSSPRGGGALLSPRGGGASLFAFFAALAHRSAFYTRGRVGRAQPPKCSACD
jgi:hypothetical protein